MAVFAAIAAPPDAEIKKKGRCRPRIIACRAAVNAGISRAGPQRIDVRHRRRSTDMFSPQPPRHTSTLPIYAPLGQNPLDKGRGRAVRSPSYEEPNLPGDNAQ